MWQIVQSFPPCHPKTPTINVMFCADNQRGITVDVVYSPSQINRTSSHSLTSYKINCSTSTTISFQVPTIYIYIFICFLCNYRITGRKTQCIISQWRINITPVLLCVQSDALFFLPLQFFQCKSNLKPCLKPASALTH